MSHWIAKGEEEMLWPEFEQALKNPREELVSSGEKLEKYLKENPSIDEILWSLQRGNLLELIIRLVWKC